MDPLAPFSPKTRAWFERAFAGPTPAQVQGWPAIASGGNVLIQAPTGSGKTLAAFLYGIDRLDRNPGGGLRLLYVSPLKALNYDVERNLRGPLAGLQSDAPRRRPHRRHAAEGAARARQGAARHPDHDAGVALPAAHLAGARDAALARDGDRRRGARRRRHEARRAPRALAGAARRLARQAGAAHRPLGDPAPARGDRPLRLRRPRDRARRRGHAQGARPRGRRAVEDMREPGRRAVAAGPDGRDGRHERESIWPSIYPACSSSSRRTARRSSSSTAAASPSGWRCGSTSWPRRRSRAPTTARSRASSA